MTETTRTWQKAGGGRAQDNNKEAHGKNKQTWESTWREQGSTKQRQSTILTVLTANSMKISVKSFSYPKKTFPSEKDLC